MRIGISICSNYRVDDPRQGARYMIERAAASRAADLDSLFAGDHHVTPTAYYQNNAILGRLLAEWGDKPAGALYLLPLWNPVKVSTVPESKIGAANAGVAATSAATTAAAGERER